MQHNTIGGGSNLHFRLRNSLDNYKEYGGFGAYIMDNTSGSEDGALTFYTTHNGSHRTRRMTILSGGNIGVGTINPLHKLDVVGSVNAQQYVTVSKNGSYRVGLNGQTDGYITGRNNNVENKFQIHSNGNSWFNGGNVGIGTTAPFSKFQVEGRSSVGNSGLLNLDWTYENNWGGSAGKWAGYIGFNAYRNNDNIKDFFHRRNNYTKRMVFEGGNNGFRWLGENDGPDWGTTTISRQMTELMVLKSDGNLGIGTTVPDAKLTVKGNIHTQEVKVDLLGAVMPDYVFTANYDLKTLKEVAAYIKDKGHLPNIPSAKEVATNGLLLKTMNLKLLEKIEELTLYTIQQEKRIETLEQENKARKDHQARIALLEQKIALLLNKQ
jgi:hypothetical protein